MYHQQAMMQNRLQRPTVNIDWKRGLIVSNYWNDNVYCDLDQ